MTQKQTLSHYYGFIAFVLFFLENVISAAGILPKLSLHSLKRVVLTVERP